jgi:hypothetical protein
LLTLDLYAQKPFPLKLVPVSIDETDTKYGLLSLLERGLVPAAARITFDPPPFAPRKVDFHEASKINDKNQQGNRKVFKKQGKMTT